MVKYQVNEKANKKDKEMEKGEVEKEVRRQTSYMRKMRIMKVHVLEMKTMERMKGQLIKYKMVNYQVEISGQERRGGGGGGGGSGRGQ